MITEENDSIVIAGGGIHGVMILGALQNVFDSNIIDIKKINLLVGTSVGSIICYLLVLGMFPIEMITNLIKFKDELCDVSMKFNMMKMMKLEGGLSFSNIQQMLEKVTLNKTGTLFTMKSLYEKFQKKLVCVSYNYTLRKIEYITHDNYPDLPCILAIKMSCSIPIVFERCMYNDYHYIDGGVYDNLAIQYPFNEGSKYPIAFNINYISNIQKDDNLKLQVYMYELYKILINSISHHKCEIFKDKVKIINITPSTANPLWNSDLSIIELLDMFSNGYNSYKNE